MTEPKPPKLIAGVARIVASRKPTKRQRLRQQRQVAAWQRAVIVRKSLHDKEIQP